MSTLCIACGMPMEKAQDFAMEDTRKNYCRYCARPDGTMQNYEEKLASLAAFSVRTQGITAESARSAARAMMEKLPAWSTK